MDTLSAYEKIAKDYRRRIWDIVVNFLSDEYPKRFVVADIGCGKGSACIKFLSLNAKGICIGLDLSPSMLFEGLKDIRRQTFEHRVMLIGGDMAYLPLRDNSFDKVISISSLHHIINRSERLRALMEFKRILRVGGKVLITVWGRYQLNILRSALAQLYLYFIGAKGSPWDITLCSKSGCRDYHFYSLRELVKEVRDAGLKILSSGVYIPGGKKAFTRNTRNYYILAAKIS